ncbi:hypothetical protein HanXRQr2_Chr03g0105021 [Helianthus annuus]|uniref:Uncharacterized protein n=1 Tax=Helianthus annuus TaxID=4232 RepID=A0A9K3NVA4_HELAN|nr:hypothetical protein HanXRQr2_Chr03g0105021 [Helianthus annuus]KAJ0943220.1 hypothetical protein HanPSC8_Chr03g0101491 [Helianthus annuus]
MDGSLGKKRISELCRLFRRKFGLMVGNMFEVGSRCRVEFYCENVHILWLNLDLFILVPAFFYFVIIKTQKIHFLVFV